MLFIKIFLVLILLQLGGIYTALEKINKSLKEKK